MRLMEPNQTTQPAGTVTAKTVAAVDIGANAIRMVIAEVSGDGRIDVSSGCNGRCGWDRIRSAAAGSAARA